MRLLVFFDLPVKEPHNRREATSFRKFLLDDGFYMVQYSVYCRICDGIDAVKKHEQRIISNLPQEGSIRTMSITENQYMSMKILIGEKTKKEKMLSEEQISMF